MTEATSLVIASTLTPAVLRETTDFNDFKTLLEEFYGDIAMAEEVIGDGFTVLKDKASLVGVPLMFVSWSFSLGDYADRQFVTARVVAQNPRTGGMRKVIINDGSSGLCEQLREYTTSHGGRQGGLGARFGLTRSDYTYRDEKTGDVTPATTFYIATSGSE